MKVSRLLEAASQATRFMRAKHISFRGDYASWEEASIASKGYDDTAILTKVREACRKVKAGKAMYERDSVLFYEPEYVWPVLSCLHFVAARNQGRLNVYDFGGSLGSFYYQHRRFLDCIDTTWTVIEQPHYADAGNEEFATSNLRFTTAIDQSEVSSCHATLLLSGVLHYLPDPPETLANLLSLPWAMIIVDRTPFVSTRDADRLTIQTVPSSIYKASYPAWFFARGAFLRRCGENFDLVASWQSLDRYMLDRKLVFTEGHCFIRKVDRSKASCGT